MNRGDYELLSEVNKNICKISEKLNEILIYLKEIEKGDSEYYSAEFNNKIIKKMIKEFMDEKPVEEKKKKNHYMGGNYITDPSNINYGNPYLYPKPPEHVEEKKESKYAADGNLLITDKFGNKAKTLAYYKDRLWWKKKVTKPVEEKKKD